MTTTPREGTMNHKDRFGLVVWLILSGLFVTFVHEFTYRRVGGIQSSNRTSSGYL